MAGKPIRTIYDVWCSDPQYIGDRVPAKSAVLTEVVVRQANHGIDIALELKILDQVLERRAVVDCVMRDQTYCQGFSLTVVAWLHQITAAAAFAERSHPSFHWRVSARKGIERRCLDHEIWLVSLFLVVINPQNIFRRLQPFQDGGLVFKDDGETPFGV